MDRAEAERTLGPHVIWVGPYAAISVDNARRLLSANRYQLLRRDAIRNVGPSHNTLYPWNVVDYLALSISDAAPLPEVPAEPEPEVRVQPSGCETTDGAPIPNESFTTPKPEHLPPITLNQVAERLLQDTRPDAEPEPEADFVTHVTQSHVCDQCRQEMHDASGQPLTFARQRSTATCPGCLQATSIYAVLHRCRCGVVLESPTSCSGRECSCPQCHSVSTVPHNLLLPKTDASIDRRDSFEITCAACEATAAVCKSDVGSRVSCLNCFQVFDVPRYGKKLPVARQAEPLPMIRCAGCGQRVPLDANACPVCKASIL